MTVRDLMEQLKNLDPDLRLEKPFHRGEYDDRCEPANVRVTEEEYSIYGLPPNKAAFVWFE